MHAMIIDVKINFLEAMEVFFYLLLLSIIRARLVTLIEYIHCWLYHLPSLNVKMATKSVDIFCQCLLFFRSKGKVIGMDVLDENYNQYNGLAFHLIFQCFSYTLTTIYCVFEFKNDFEKLAFCLVTYGFAIQVSIDIQ